MALVRTTQGASSDSNTRRGYHYDVFLSFRGEDTRKTFTDHLYTALISAGYRTFRDDDELETGEDIKSVLKQAIQMSRTSVIVFSKDYASSRWCLNELVEIVDHKRASSDHVVIPVFYDVDPSHVRKQTGSIAEAFARHRKTEPPDMMERWRKALAEVADLAGKVLQNQAYGYESKFIKDIVKVIRDKLSRTHLSVESKLVGIHSRVDHINLWLQDPSHDVGILVVYGLPGIGKTTIAKCVYNSNFKSFEGSSYVESIRETASHPDGLVQIQKQILYDILNGKKEKIHNASEGIIKIGRAISFRRVLLVLDDVDHMDQLDAVLRMKDQFYPGSKIIITTRRKRLLKAHEGITVHEVGPLGFNESLELLSQHAFGQDHPLEGYEKYSKEVVQHSGRLPLALKVLGSSLFGEPKHVWKSTLEKLEVIPNGEIMNKLRISYDSLQDDHDQKLFLHIACFFIGKDEDYIVRILDGCDFKTICGIQNLRDRCLVTIDRDKLSMHDVIRDMGREIVRRESYEPRNRSRLWRSKDSCEVLREKNGTQAIEGLMLGMHELLTNSPINSNENVLGTNSFARMHKLKLLCLRHVRLDGCYAELPTGLRWLCWLEFPLDSIPVDFSLEKLVVLEMQYSNLRQLCKRANFLPSLKILDVSHSHGLSEIIDFSLCPKLEELILVDCTSLIDVHESIGSLERLVYLNMKDCKNLRMLPKNMCMLKSLETLILSGCSNLDEFPVEMMKKMESLEVLATDGIPLGPERSSIILSSFPCSLVELSLKGCNLSDDVFPTDLSNLSYLRRLHLDENPICSLPVFIKGLRRLDHLSFRNCNRLELLVGLPKVHQSTNIEGCISLRKIKYLPREQRSRMYAARDNYNLVEWEHFYKLEPIDRVDVEIIKLLGLCNLESMPAIRMFNPHRSRDPKEVPVQGLHQYGIFSTFFAGNEVPGRFSYKNTKSSISFIVPLLLASHRIRGLNIFATYAKEENPNNDSYDFSIIMTKVSNKSKGLKWIYIPLSYGIPGDGEDMIWLSHWKMENETILQCGDQVVVSVLAEPNKLFRMKELGVELVQEHQNNMMISTQHNTKSNPNYPFVIGGDLSMWEHIPGIYFLGCIKEVVENTNIFPRRFLNSLIMDTDEEDTGMKEEQEDEPDYTIGRTRDASDNCGPGGWKVLLTAAGLFFTLALVVRSSISQKKKRQ
ncbi:disease resistance protein RUN1-like isoform X2 [Malus sylvestris]|uniref:disease resistance protein RUN1-like isoform X2 n=1 Tax=Malus sylvestris TaxID=3752 RepID=UPI0021ACD9CD|nr:disease resistance protein RUN1-like isoform X2 [Malus sylvestris]